MKLVFVHGWGFDASFWLPLRKRLQQFAHCAEDRGYFGAPRTCATPPRCLAVTHSFGTVRILADPPPGIAGIVAINGFDRFAAGAGFPGIAPRVLDRMLRRWREDPAATLADFRERCGAGAATGPIEAQLLGADLARMRDVDVRDVTAGLDIPLLSLQAAHDRILPAAMREAAFAGAVRVTRRVHPAAGHGLPHEDPRWCADAIGGFVGELE